jgi:GT2 family glycosyltransferase
MAISMEGKRMVDKTKFTIIVPTKERADTLYHCLQTLVRQRYENFEILVSDNFSQDNTEQIVRGIRDSRIRYINTGRRVGMSRNFEFALSHVKNGWIIISAMMMAFCQMRWLLRTTSFVTQGVKRSPRSGIIILGPTLTELFRQTA